MAALTHLKCQNCNSMLFACDFCNEPLAKDGKILCLQAISSLDNLHGHPSDYVDIRPQDSVAVENNDDETIEELKR